jgi:shikimate dehydrogenase
MAEHPFFTLTDLQRWKAEGLPVDADGRKPGLAVFGCPVKHSLSPELHNPALREIGSQLSYIRLHIEPEEFRQAVDLIRELGFVGANVTIPHKFSALEYAEVLHPNAARLGAVNTLIFANGTAEGRNSDGPGFVRAVNEAFGAPLSALRVLIIGAGGGAGRAVAAQCGIENCRHLMLMNRSAEKLAPLAAEIAAYFPAERLTCRDWTPEALAETLPEVDLIVNATQLGMKADDGAVLPGNLLEARHFVYDMVYKPAAVTPLLADAARAGCKSINGLPMLLHQGCVSFEWWFGCQAPVELMRASLAKFCP